MTRLKTMKKHKERNRVIRCSSWLGITVLCFLNSGSHVFGEVHRLGDAPAYLIRAQSRVRNDLHESQSMNQVRLVGRDWNHAVSRVRCLLCKGHALLELGLANLDAQRAEMPALLRLSGAPGNSESATKPDGRADKAGSGGDNVVENGVTHNWVPALMGALSANLGVLFGIWIAMRIVTPNGQAELRGDSAISEQKSQTGATLALAQWFGVLIGLDSSRSGPPTQA